MSKVDTELYRVKFVENGFDRGGRTQEPNHVSGTPFKQSLSLHRELLPDNRTANCRL